MGTSRWHKIYRAQIQAPRELLFDLTSDLSNYERWLPPSDQYRATTDVEPYPVELGSRYHDGQPGIAGKDWWGKVVGFVPPGSIDFHHAIHVVQLRARVEVDIHYALEPEQGATLLTRWLALEITMPWVTRPLRAAITSRFHRENVRTLAALTAYAERHADGD